MSTFPKQADNYKNNLSSKMIQARMNRFRKSISYNTSLDNTIIQKILQKNEIENKNLLLYLHAAAAKAATPAPAALIPTAKGPRSPPR